MSLHRVLRKKEGFAGQLSVVLPRKILSDLCNNNPLVEKLYITDIGYYPKAQYHYRQGYTASISTYLFIAWREMAALR